MLLWVDLRDPSRDEVDEVAKELGLDDESVERLLDPSDGVSFRDRREYIHVTASAPGHGSRLGAERDRVRGGRELGRDGPRAPGGGARPVRRARRGLGPNGRPRRADVPRRVARVGARRAFERVRADRGRARAGRLERDAWRERPRGRDRAARDAAIAGRQAAAIARLTPVAAARTRASGARGPRRRRLGTKVRAPRGPLRADARRCARRPREHLRIVRRPDRPDGPPDERDRQGSHARVRDLPSRRPDRRDHGHELQAEPVHAPLLFWVTIAVIISIGVVTLVAAKARDWI